MQHVTKLSVNENFQARSLIGARNSQKWLEKAMGYAHPPESDDINIYTRIVREDYAPWIYEMLDVPKQKGNWRKDVFQVSAETPLDLEVGVGNGYFFEHHRKTFPNRMCVGLELKYKQLVQTVKRSLLYDRKHFRLGRFDAKYLDDVFSAGELNNVYVFFPDPWEKKRQLKKRLLGPEFLNSLFEMQRPGSFFEFKTDSRAYYEWVCERIKLTPYILDYQSDNFHFSERAKDNFQTHFEKLWTQKGRPTHYIKLLRP
jgi:tRNA (guanine-N7-)-methyltransferase